MNAVIRWDSYADAERRYVVRGVPGAFYVAGRAVWRGSLCFLLFPESHNTRGLPAPDGVIATVSGRVLVWGAAAFDALYRL